MNRLIPSAFLIYAISCATVAPSSPSVQLRVESVTEQPDGAIVVLELSNLGERPFEYYGYEKDVLVPEVDVKHWRGWSSGGFVCYTGMQRFALLPGERVRFKTRVFAKGLVRLSVPSAGASGQVATAEVLLPGA